MTTTTPATDVAIVDPQFSDAERYALAAFLAGYRGLTRDAYALDLRQFFAWCEEHNLRLFAVRRADIECYAVTSRNAVALAPPSLDGCAPSPASTASRAGGAPRALPGGSRSSSASRLRVPRGRTGSE